MNITQIKELIDFYPSQCRYLAIYWDSQRHMVFWYTGRNDAPILPETVRTIVQVFNIEIEQIERDESWLLLDWELGEASVLDWQQADQICQRQFQENPELALNAAANALAVAKRVHLQWQEFKK